MIFIWNPKKAAANRRKHGVDFEEAASVFLDPHSMTGSDPDHSVGERRWLTFGISGQERLLVVSHTDDGDTIRLVSARPATRKERQLYE